VTHAATPNFVIFSAGIGARLGFGMPEFLVRIAERPLYEYQLEQLQMLPGALHIVCGFQASTVRDEVDRYVSRTPGFIPQLSFIHNDQFESPQVTSISCALKTISLDRPTYFIDGDLLFHRDVLNALSKCPRTTVVVRREVSPDAVLAATDQGRLKRFKRGGTGNVEGANIVKYEPEDLVKLASLAAQGSVTHHFELINQLIEAGVEVGFEVGEISEVDQPEDIARAAAFVARLG